ncbi:MAG: recombination regulator RecX [Clostridium sp.]|nr:recombination regulator RecX [Clostridium sp.]
MLITRIEQGKGKRYNIYSDCEFLFSLYGRELKKYHIAENVDVPEDVLSEIMDNIIYKRAKERALYLLDSRPYTCYMMRDKLISSEYPAEIADRVVSFLKEYRYLDDMAYVRMYIETYSQTKSKRQIQFDLQKKKIAKNLIDEYMSQQDYSEEECFRRQFDRYTRGKDMKDWNVRQKVFRYFFGKGFSYDLIEEYIKIWSEHAEE